MLFHHVRAANARNLLQDGRLPQQLSRLDPAFQKAFRWDFRGSRLNDILGLGAAGRMQLKELACDTYLTPAEKSLLSTFMGCSPTGTCQHVLSLSCYKLMIFFRADGVLPSALQWV